MTSGMPASKPRPAPKAKTSLGFLLLAAGGGVLGFFAAKFAKGFIPLHETMGVLSPWDLLALPALWLLAVGLHEAGHLAGGMSRGMRFLLFIAGPFGWVRTREGIRFRWYFNLGTFGGIAAALPATDRPLKPQLLRLVAGGPLASLLLSALAFAAYGPLDGRAAAYALIFGALSFMVFLVTAAPFRAGGFMSDGLQFVELSRNPALVERRVRLSSLMGVGLTGVRPRDLDPALLAQAQALTGDETLYDIGVWFYSYGHALDRGDITAAGHWLDRIEAVLDKYPDGFRQAVTVELALFEALHRRRLDVARAWWAGSRGGVVDPSRRALAEAALAALAGQTTAARAALDRAQAQLGRGLDPSLGAVSADQIADLRHHLEASSTPITGA
jgi:hypothetical protein